MGVVVVPNSTADSDQQQDSRGRNQAQRALPGEAEARRPRVVGATPCERDRDDCEDSCYREPIGYRPKECGREVAVAVHVRIGVGRRTANEIECVFQSKVIKNRRNDEDANNDAVADKFIGDYSLDKQREQDEGKNLRKGNEVELFDILEQLIVMVAGNSLHEDAAEASDRKQDELNETQSEQLREPVGRFADR